jgi:hypothetical protein
MNVDEDDPFSEEAHRRLLAELKAEANAGDEMSALILQQSRFTQAAMEQGELDAGRAMSERMQAKIADLRRKRDDDK